MTFSLSTLSLQVDTTSLGATVGSTTAATGGTAAVAAALVVVVCGATDFC